MTTKYTIRFNPNGYARAPREIPYNSDYITPSKIYEIVNDSRSDDSRSFGAMSDTSVPGDKPMLCLWSRCAHLGGKDWEHVDISILIDWCEEFCQDEFTLKDGLLTFFSEEDFIIFILAEPFKYELVDN